MRILGDGSAKTVWASGDTRAVTDADLRGRTGEEASASKLLRTGDDPIVGS
jgi:hypothetical protein